MILVLLTNNISHRFCVGSFISRFPGSLDPGERRVMKVLDCLKYGSDNAVSLDYISAMTGLGKRACREEMSRITVSGEEVVCTDANGSGYYLAAGIEEAKRCQKYNRSYLLSSIEKDKGIRKFIARKENEQQISLFKD